MRFDIRAHRFSTVFLATLVLLAAGCNRTPQPTQTAQNQPGAAPQAPAAQPAAPPAATPQPAPIIPSQNPTQSPAAQNPAAAAPAPPAPGNAQPPAEPAAGVPEAAPAPAPPPPPPPRQATLAAGRQISIRTIDTISTKAAQTGDVFSASLAEPITSGKWVIARRGANVTGRVVDSDPGGRVKGVARLVVRITGITLADGRRIQVSTNSLAREARTTKKKDTAKIGIGAGVGALIGGLAGGGKGAGIGALAGGGAGTGVVLATRGEPAVIPTESVLTFTLSSPVRVVERESR